MTITPLLTVAVKNSGISPNPNPIPYGGLPVNCPGGHVSEDVVLPAATSNAQLPFPAGVTTAAILIIQALTTTDLVVTYKGQTMSVPVGQPVIFYGVTQSNVTVSTTLGGEILCTVGG